MRPVHLAAAAVVLFFGLFYCQLWLGVNPRLIYHNQGPVFLIGFDFLKSFLSRPGGPLDYVWLFCFQFYYYPWAGALIATATAALICLAGRGVLTVMAGARPHPGTCIFPAFLILLIYSRYGADVYVFFQILAALWLVMLYASLPLRGRLPRLAAFLLISAACYYLAGSGYVLFAVLCGILEMLRRRSPLLGLLMLLCGPAAPYGFAMYSYQASLPEVYAPLLPVAKRILVALAPPFELRQGLHLALVLFFPASAIWMAVRKPLAAASRVAMRLLSRPWAAGRGRGKKKAAPPRAVATPAGPSLGPLAGLVLLTTIAMPVSLDKLTRTLIEIDYAAGNRMWPEVLAKAESLPLEYHGIYVMNVVNQALFETGRLPYDMFAHPQTADRDSVFLTFAVPPDQRDRYDRLSAFFYDLGFINEAEHFSHEALERRGQEPAILQRLAKINILKGLPVAARTFLGALAKNPLYREWAQEYIRKLDADPLMAGDEELKAARSRMIQLEYTIGAKGREEEIGPLIVRALEDKLRTDSHSKLAFEYLMAHYLLTNQLDKVVAGMKHLDDLGYRDIPTDYEEAILLYLAMHHGQTPQLNGRTISNKTLGSFRRYRDEIARLGDDKPAVYRALMKTHDRTYFLYCTVGFSDSRFAPGSQEGEPTAGGRQ